jgi:hypothetical protein
MSEEEKASAQEDDDKLNDYIDSQSYAFQRNGSVYYVINRRDGVATPIGSEDRGGRPVALKAAKEFIERSIAERASIAEREAEYLSRVKR